MIQNLKQETVRFADVNPAAYNPRVRLLPGDSEYQNILASLREFGYLGGMVWNRTSGNLVGGHQRMWIMQENGLTECTMAVVELDPVKEKDLNLRLNRVGGRWDVPQLEAVLAELASVPALDLRRLGFTPVELQTHLGNKTKTPRRDPDAAPTPPARALTRPGDLYELAGMDLNPTHRLICGDSRERGTFEKLLEDRRPRLIFTDPPYGVSYDNSQRGDGRTPKGLVRNDEIKAVTLEDFLCTIFGHLFSFSADRVALYCFYASKTHIEFETALRRAGWRVKQQLLWVKQMALSRADYHWSHEPILYACKAEHNCDWLGPRTQTTLFERTEADLARLKKDELLELLVALRREADTWEENRDAPSVYIHPTQKPVSLAARAMANSTSAGDVVLDAFAGSGSTIIAGEMQRRPVCAVEDSPNHCDAIVRRYLETFEGAVATRNGQPLTLAELLAGPKDHAEQ